MSASNPRIVKPPRSPNRSPTKRASSTTSPRRGVTLHAASSCFVSSDARLEGAINLADGCVLHPRCAVIVSSGASLSFGPGCVVEENAVVRHVGPGHATIGQHNVFMVSSFVDVLEIGDWNTFAPRARVEGVRVGDQCTFGAGTVVGPNHHYLAPKPRDARDARDADGDTHMTSPTAPAPKVPSRTVVYGASSAARAWDGSGEAMEKNVRASATEFLREVLPKSNKQRPLN